MTLRDTFVDNSEGERKTIGKLYLPDNWVQAVLDRFYKDRYSVAEIASESGIDIYKIRHVIEVHRSFYGCS